VRLGIRTRIRAWRSRDTLDDEVLEACEITHLLAQPAAPLRAPNGMPERLRVAFVVPFFRHGSGGHMTIANLVRGLERRGHACSLWIDDPGRRLASSARAEQELREWFGPFEAEVRYGVDDWEGTDVAVATGWQTVARVRTLPDAAARAYLVQDHEPEFFGTSVHRLWATDSYRHDLYPITAGRWLAELMEHDYGLAATSFDLGIDTRHYYPQQVTRREDVVLFYARASTPRRAVPLALVALRELQRRRPQTEVWLYGHGSAPRLDFLVRNIGVVSAHDLPRLYSEATVGLVLSLTNYSLVAQEMLACGLPCVELDSPSVVAAFGHDGPVDLAEPDPAAIAAAVERLLDDAPLRTARAEAGAAWAAARTWDAAAAQVEQGLRAALTRAAASVAT
jgi:glycosyltransferase involved in cell wall biosynthesis